MAHLSSFYFATNPAYEILILKISMCICVIEAQNVGEFFSTTVNQTEFQIHQKIVIYFTNLPLFKIVLILVKIS